MTSMAILILIFSTPAIPTVQNLVSIQAFRRARYITNDFFQYSKLIFKSVM